MSSSNHHHHRLAATRPGKYRTLCDLPVELLCMVISYVKRDLRTVRSCALACRCLRAVAIEHFFQSSRLRICDIASFDHLTSFLHTNPSICKKIRTLDLSGKAGRSTTPFTTIGETVVVKLLRLLPNLTSLSLRSFVYEDPPKPGSGSGSGSQVQEDIPGPFHLKSLHLGLARAEDTRHRSSLSGFFRILSLFSIEALTAYQNDGMFKPRASLDPEVLHRPLRIKNLFLSGLHYRSPLLLNALAKSIEPGSLQSLKIYTKTTAIVSATGKLLARVGGELTNLEIDACGPYWLSERAKWKDPLDSHWHTLNLTSCPKLESLSIRIYFRGSVVAPPPPDVPALCLAGAGMISQASNTLREVTISLIDLPRLTTLTNRRLLRLQEFDKVITAEKFPAMRKVYLRIKPCDDLRKKQGYTWQTLSIAVQRALSGMHSRGLLDIKST